MARIFECNALLVRNGGEPRVLASAPVPMRLTPGDLAVAALTLTTGERTGRGLEKAIPTEWQFHPVRSANAILGVLALARDDGARPLRAGQLQLLDNLLDQIALALERGRLESEAREFARVRERDRICSVLVSTIGQDLKPSVETIANAVRELRRSGSVDKELVSALGSEAARLERYVSNLADLGSYDNQEPLRAGSVTINLVHRAVSRDGVAVHLTPKEYAVLAELAKHPGRVLTHAHLLRTRGARRRRTKPSICASPSGASAKSWSAIRHVPT